MFNVTKLEDGSFIFKIDNKRFILNNELELIKTMLSIGIPENEVELGVGAFVIEEHNYVEYGLNGLFVFSEKR